MSVRLVSIGDVVEKISTWNPISRGDGEFDYIDLSAVDQDTKRIVQPNRLSTSEAPSRARQLVAAGDVLVSTVRPNLNGVAKAGAEHEGMTASTGFCVLRPRKKLLSENYLFQWVKSPSFVKDMVQKATGASYPAVSDRIIKESLIPLPPLDEQKRIAAILDRADALRAKRGQAIALLDSLTQSIFLEMFGDPIQNPRGYKSLSLGDLLAEIQSGWSPICLERPAFEGEWGVLKLSAVTSGRFRSEEQKALPEDLDPKPKLEVRQGDVLFTRKNTYNLVAACSIVDECRSKLMIPDLIFRLIIRDRRILLPEYLFACLSNMAVRGRVQLLAGGAAGSMPNISKERLRGFEILVPPIDEQQRFASLTSLVRGQQRKLDQQNLEISDMLGSLQKYSFLEDIHAR